MLACKDRMSHPVAPDALERTRQRSADVDRLVRAAWARWLAPQMPAGLAVLAVGGYGRGELFPYSDIDLLLLEEKKRDASDSLSGFVRELWDANLKLSQSVRTIEECRELDPRNVELSVSLLDRRFLCGDNDLFGKLQSRMQPKSALPGEICRMAEERHHKYQDTIFHLEPDIKECPGGLRDLHVLHWLSLLKKEQAPELPEEKQFLAQVRWLMHEQSKRDNNVFRYELQDQVAEQMRLDPAELMHRYYRYARNIHKLAHRALDRAAETAPSLLRGLRDWRSKLSSSDFTVSRDRLLIRSPQGFASDRDAMFRLFLFIARHGVVMSADAEDRVQGLAAQGALWNWKQWKELLSQPRTAAALRAMHVTGVLQRQLPAWKRIECLVSRDFYHRYTVDEHTLVTLDQIDQLPEMKHPSVRRFQNLREEITEVASLRMALLLHDVGKGSGHAHEEESMRIGQEFLARLETPADERDEILYLVEKHLELSTLAATRDLEDEATIQQAADRIGTIERLRLLALLTWADIRSVNPEAMTPWRKERLWHAYRAVARELTRELEDDRIASELHSDGTSFMAGLPVRYLRRYQADERAAHAALAEVSRKEGAAVALEREGALWRLTVVTQDRPRLLANLAGSLAALGMNILSVDAFANTKKEVLDIFFFEDPLRNLELNPSEREVLTDTIRRVLSGKENLEALLRRRHRPAARVVTQIHPSVGVDNDSSRQATLLEVVAQDRPGLLYDLARTISDAGCNIEVVLMETRAMRAMDTLYLTSNGEKLSEEAARQLAGRLQQVCEPETETKR
jgi:[protein-PII] uridylyltransferase